MPMSIERASLYEKYRLPYSDQAIPDLLQQIGSIDTVADIGAGTGQLSRLFSPHCDYVYTIEPDESMCHVAQDALSSYANITIINGSAEKTTLPDASVDLLAIGNAFHRFQPEACDELHRILKNDGWIVMVSYEYLNKSFTDLLFSKLATLDTLATKSKQNWRRTPQENLVGKTDRCSKSYKQSETVEWESFWGAARAGIESPEQQEDHFTQFEKINREVFDTFAESGKMQIDYETRISWGRKP